MLVDTSVWVNHLRRGNPILVSALEDGDVRCHPFIQGELACGNLRNREEFLSLLATLPEVPSASHEEARALLDVRKLWGTGLGWVDVHLLASALLAGVPLWTLDRRLASVARRLEIGFQR